MTKEAEQLMAEALKGVKLNGGFSPIQVGRKIGLTRPQAEAAARSLSNAGILVLGFDFSAQFSPDFRKSRVAAERKGDRKKKSRATPGRTSATAKTAP